MSTETAKQCSDRLGAYQCGLPAWHMKVPALRTHAHYFGLRHLAWSDDEEVQRKGQEVSRG